MNLCSPGPAGHAAYGADGIRTMTTLDWSRPVGREPEDCLGLPTIKQHADNGHIGSAPDFAGSRLVRTGTTFTVCCGLCGISTGPGPARWSAAAAARPRG